MRVALVQMDIRLADPTANLERAAVLVAEAAQGSDLVMLPEMWTTGYCLDQLKGGLADKAGEPTGGFLSDLARRHGVYLVGSAADECDGKVYNAATVFGPDGSLIARYAKAHLVPMMQEDLFLAPGDELTVADLAGFKAGLAICYDLRFPELFRTLALAGAEVMLLPAEWPAQRIGHWRTLAMARAIENQCYVVACNRVGRDHANAFPGHSLVIDPAGEILAEGGEVQEIVRATIDRAQVAAVRERIPVFRDRRPDLYRLS